MHWLQVHEAMDQVYAEHLPITPTTSIHIQRLPSFESLDGGEDCEKENQNPLRIYQEASQRKWERGFRDRDTACFGCFNFLTDRFRDSSERPDGDRGYYGYLWKCNSEFTDFSNGWLSKCQDLNSWRRRLFFLRDHAKEGRMLAYISEKDDGSLAVAAVISGSAKVTRLEKIQLRSLSKQQKKEVCHQLQDYDIAFRVVDPRGTIDDHYMDDLPTMLYPILIEWTDATNEHQKCLIATTDCPQDEIEDEYNTWLNYLTDTGATLPKCLSDNDVRGSWDQAVSVRYGSEGVSLSPESLTEN